MSIAMTRLILYVRDVTALKSFYQTCFGFDVLEEIEGDGWCSKRGPLNLRFIWWGGLTDTDRSRRAVGTLNWFSRCRQEWRHYESNSFVQAFK